MILLLFIRSLVYWTWAEEEETENKMISADQKQSPYTTNRKQFICSCPYYLYSHCIETHSRGWKVGGAGGMANIKAMGGDELTSR